MLLETVGQLLGGHGAVRVLLLVVRVGVVLLRGSSLGRGLGGGAGAATEHAHDAVGDGVTDCDTTVVTQHTQDVSFFLLLPICWVHDGPGWFR